MTATDDDRLRTMFLVGQALLARCQRELIKRTDGLELGVTIIVHAAEPDADNMHKAVASSLRDRAQFRGMLADCLCEATIADGIALEDVRKTAEADLARLYGRQVPEED